MVNIENEISTLMPFRTNNEVFGLRKNFEKRDKLQKNGKTD